MTVLTFNTHTYIKRLVKKGMDEKLAEEVANTLAESREIDLNNLVTKDYLKAELNQVKFDMIKWQIGIAFVAVSFTTSVLFTALKYFLGK